MQMQQICCWRLTVFMSCLIGCSVRRVNPRLRERGGLSRVGARHKGSLSGEGHRDGAEAAEIGNRLLARLQRRQAGHCAG